MSRGANSSVWFVWLSVMLWSPRLILPQTADPSLSAYVGMYRSEAHPQVVDAVFFEAGKLWIESEAIPREELSPAGQDRFVCSEKNTPDEGKIFAFSRDASGRINHLSLIHADGTASGNPELRYSDTVQRLHTYLAHQRSEVSIPMRDGVRLHAVVLRPVGSERGAPLPFLLERTPYGVDEYSSFSLNWIKPELAASGYIFVYEDIRGRFGSEGAFVMAHPLVVQRSSQDVDESTDAYDTVAWLLQHVPNNNGRIGVWGESYGAFTATMAGIHPMLR